MRIIINGTQWMEGLSIPQVLSGTVMFVSRWDLHPNINGQGLYATQSKSLIKTSHAKSYSYYSFKDH
jgi:hypothetical protein